VENEGDGWQWMLEELGRYYEHCSGAGPEAMAEAMGLALESASTLGRRTAELHIALGSGRDDPAFAPEPLTADDYARILDTLKSDARSAFDLLEENAPRLPQEAAEGAKAALERRQRVMASLNGMQVLNANASKIRIHGDYHLGQVLRTRNDYVIIDFEGEPARPMPERKAKASPLKDVAGMMRSFSYAACAGLFNHTYRRPAEFTRLLDCARYWERETASAFLAVYLETAKGAGFLPPDPEKLDLLLKLFVMEKTFYELRYELNNRPQWVRVPLQSIVDM
jgi:maltose alpha-D-glucosyltransferase/alpha-amylase